MTTACWYLYLYLALLCTLPLLQTFAATLSKRQLQWLLFLSLGVLGVCPMFSLLLGIGISFLSADGLIGPYFGMVFAGYYMEHHMDITRRKCAIAGVLFVLLIAFQVIVTYLLFQTDPSTCYRLDDRTLLPITLSACCAYVVVKYFFSHVRCPKWLCRGIVCFGNLTFGVYLFSDLMISVLAPWLNFLNSKLHVFLAMVIWEVCIFLVSALLTAALHLIPVLRKYL